MTNTYSPVPPDTTTPATTPTTPITPITPTTPTSSTGPTASSAPVAPTSPTSGSGGGSGGGSELPDTGASAELFTAGMIGALFVGVGAILLLAGRRRGPTPTHLAGD